MYTIGQVSEMFNLPISTLRYYDKEGFSRRGRDNPASGNLEKQKLKLSELLNA